jgi:hypothetical protein
MAAASLPLEVRQLQAQRAHRMHHFLWHQVRNSWMQYPPEIRQKLSDLGWEPPRPAREKDGRLLLDNFSGEDFLFMHRQMIAHVNARLAQIGDPAYPGVEGWPSIPGPSDADYPVPPAWTDPENQAFTEFIRAVKSDEFYLNNFAVWEPFYRNEVILRRLSLGQLGAMLEFTVHNYMHMRWAAQPIGDRPDPPPDRPETIPTEWDRVEYEYLGDTYSSHVNSIFWKLHGWIDDRIDDWARANGIDEINWVGTWVGVMPAGVQTPMALLSALDQGGHDHHLHEMEQAVGAIAECGIFHEFYTDAVREFAPIHG